ncbi:MAG TPA: Mrp/NBP35 family ATP-binding protein [Candidatus Sulfotelmatobacter sp.]|jgi:ATP-binding protein involved in chromosome partitioning|nr:Mrp/NBP35 family ATP-binding protein [Candidatus Sulfotelmatobacter sp.]
MAKVSDKDVLAALSKVADPDRGGDLVSLGMITGLVVKDGHVAFAIDVDPERGPKLEPLRKAAEKAVHDLAGVLTVSAVMTAERKATSGQGHSHGHAHGGHGHGAEPQLLPQVKAIIAVSSGKGGVGKSTTATNLALSFKAMGLSVGLLDADVFGPSQPRLLGVPGAQPFSPDGATMEPVDAYGLKVMSIGFLVPEDSPVVWRGPMVMGALEQLMRDVRWGELDVMVVDMPPGTGDTQLTMTQKVPLTGAVIVSTPQDIALLDTRKGLNMFRKVNVPVLGIIENMSTYHCPNCGHEAHIFGHGGARAEAAKLSADFLGELPLDIAIRTTSDEGRPITVSQPDGAHAKAYRAIAEKVWEKAQVLLSARKAPKIVMN